jgi:hypothetical protein
MDPSSKSYTVYPTGVLQQHAAACSAVQVPTVRITVLYPCELLRTLEMRVTSKASIFPSKFDGSSLEHGIFFNRSVYFSTR